MRPLILGPQGSGKGFLLTVLAGGGIDATMQSAPARRLRTADRYIVLHRARARDSIVRHNWARWVGIANPDPIAEAWADQEVADAWAQIGPHVARRPTIGLDYRDLVEDIDSVIVDLARFFGVDPWPHLGPVFDGDVALAEPIRWWPAEPVGTPVGPRWFLVPRRRGRGGRSADRYTAYLESDSGPPLVDFRPGRTVQTMEIPGVEKVALVWCAGLTDHNARLLAEQDGVIPLPLDGPVARRHRQQFRIQTEPHVGQIDIDGLPGPAVIDELLIRIDQAQAFYGYHRRPPTLDELGVVRPHAVAVARMAKLRAEALGMS